MRSLGYVVDASSPHADEEKSLTTSRPRRLRRGGNISYATFDKGGNGCFCPLPRESDRSRSISTVTGQSRAVSAEGGRKKKREKRKKSGLNRGREEEEEGEEEKNLDFFPRRAIRRPVGDLCIPLDTGYCTIPSRGQYAGTDRFGNP
ncbi:hypothetical protein BHE74_00043516 [Ensete ventricosum]|nr:hypothetical protein BHE74_00043516 [Ensete ventricosum]